jgi:hypothetical protein
MHKVTIVSAAVLLVLGGSASMAKPRKAIHHYNHALAPVSVPQDPQAYAMWVARQTWGPNRALCDEGGYRIRPCDMVPEAPSR